jgi:hypothetical protein
MDTEEIATMTPGPAPPREFEPRHRYGKRWGRSSRTIRRWIAAGVIRPEDTQIANGREYVSVTAIPRAHAPKKRVARPAATSIEDHP